MCIGTIQDQIDWLTKMNILLEDDNFNLDTACRIKNFYAKTHLQSRVVFDWLATSHKQAILRLSDSRFLQVRQDLTAHLDQRIRTLSLYILNERGADKLVSPSEDNKIKSDRWRSNRNGDESYNVRLLEASLHVSDILFACKEVIEQICEANKNFTDKELSPFVEESLPQYLQMLSDLSNASEEFISELQGNFRKLTDLIASEDFVGAKVKLSSIGELSLWGAARESI